MLRSTCATYSVAAPVTPCALACTLVMPLAAEVAPAVVAAGVSIAATDAFVEFQVNVTPVITLSMVSRATARYARRRPSDVIVKVSGTVAATEPVSIETTIRLMGVCTVSGETPIVVPAVARIWVVPTANAVTAPVDASTDATEGDVDDHAKVGCVAIGLPRPSTAAAE